MPKAPTPWFRKGRGWFAQIDRKQVPLAGIDATYKQAEQALARLRTTPASLRQNRNLSIEQLCELFGREKATVLKPKTLESYRHHLNEFCREFGTRKAWKMTLLDFDDWIKSHKTWNGSTRRLITTIVKAVFSWATKRKLVPENPLLEVELPEMGVREVMSEQEAERFFAAIRSRHVRELVIALRETGARPGEIASATAAGLKREARTLFVSGKRGSRVVTLNDAAFALISRLAELRPNGPIFRTATGLPWNEDLMYNCFRRLRDKTGIQNATAYAYRHLFATAACRNNVNPFVLATLMGHKDMKMILKVYAKHAPETLRAAAEQVQAKDKTA